MNKILVIDDNQDNLAVIREMLQHLHPQYHFLSARNGEDGISIARSEQPDTILLDIQMPGMDGYEVCRELRKDERTRHLPIVFLTAVKTSSSDRIRGLEIGGDAYLMKPIDMAELSAYLQVMLRIKKAEDDLRKENLHLDSLVQDRTREMTKMVRNLKLTREELQERVAEMTALNSIGSSTAESLEIDVMIQSALEGISAQVHPDLTLLFLLEGDDLFVHGSIAGSPGYQHGQTPVHKVGKCLCGLAVQNRSAVYSLNIHHDPRCTWDECKQINMISFAALPIYHAGEIIGVLGLGSVKERAFQKQDPFLRAMVQHIGVSLQNAILYDKLMEHNKMLEQEIISRRTAEEQLNILTRSVIQSPASIMITSREGAIEYVNPKFESISGYTLSEVIGKNPRLLKSGAQDSKFYQNMWETITSGREWQGQFCNKKKNGVLYWENAVISAIVDENDQTTHYLAVKEDITEKKRNEEERRKIEALMSQSQKLETIGTLAGGVAHDLNNVLTPIMGYAELALMEKGLGSSLINDLNQVLSGAKRGKDLIDQILLFSKQTVKPHHSLSLQDVILDAMKLLRPTIPSSITIRQNIDPDCPEIHGDYTQIHQVIVNICTNARQVLKQNKGTITINLQHHFLSREFIQLFPHLPDVEYAVITISDDGAGMDKKTLDRIFEPFFTTKDRHRGTGLGLSVVQGIVKSHHGEIVVNSTPGKGTIFNIYFPLLSPEIKTDETVEKSIHRGTGSEKILLVDDEPVIAHVMEKMLKESGYDVTAFTDGKAAWQLLQTSGVKFDLVISDLTMPDLTGLDLAGLIQSLNDKIPVLIMTGYGNNLSAETMREYSIIQVLEKPVPIISLTAAVRNALDMTAGSG